MTVGQEAERCRNRTEGRWWDKLWTTCLKSFSSALKMWTEMEAFKGGLDHCFHPGSPPPVLSLASALLDFVFINYFHRNKYITYTLDDQEIWHQKRTTCPRRMTVKEFFYYGLSKFASASWFLQTGPRYHSASILGTLYPCNLTKVL